MRRPFASIIMKYTFLILADLAVLTGCAKEELLHIEYDNSDSSEITFNVAPVTKSATDAFASTSVFETNAYYLSSDSDWATSASDGVEYIPDNRVSWEDNAWRLENTYNWPEAGGNLTFYSWTLNKDNLDFNPQSDAAVSIDPVKGVCLKNFDISLDSNLDFMVASAAVNKSENTGSNLKASAVTTQFEHQLSCVRITARTSEDYTTSKEFHITSILMKNVAVEADYQQSTCEDGIWSEIHQWTVNGTGDAIYGDYSSNPLTITTETTELPAERAIYIPQTFTEDSEFLQVNYTIKDLYSGLVENITENIALGSITDGGCFSNGKLYTINITIGLDSVFWTPALVDWEDAA